MPFNSFRDVIGSAIVEVVADTSQLDRGLRQGLSGSEKLVQSFSRNIKGMIAGALGGLTVVGVTASIRGMVEEVVNLGDELLRTSQKTGITVESLSKLKYSADLADISFGEVAQGVRFLSTAIADTLAGATTDGARALQLLVPEIQDLLASGATTEDVLFRLADGFASLEDGAIKSDLAVKIFSRSGTTMIPLLNMGAAGLRTMYEEAERAGVVMSTQTAAAADQLSDDIKRLGAAILGAKTATAEDFIPAIDNVVQSMTGWILANRELITSGITKWVTNFTSTATMLYNKLQPIANVLNWINEMLSRAGKFIGRGLPGAEFRYFGAGVLPIHRKPTTGMEGQAEALGELQKKTKDVTTATGNLDAMYRRVFGGAGGGAGGGGGGRGGGKSVAQIGIENLNDSLEAQIEQLRKTSDTFGQSANAVIDYEAALLRAKGASADLVDEWTKLSKRVALQELTERARQSFESLAQAIADFNEETFEFLGLPGVRIAFVKDLSQITEDVKNSVSEMNQFVIEGARNMQDLLARTIGDAFRGEFDNIGEAFAELIQDMLAQILAFKLMTALFGPTFGTTGEIGGWLGKGLGFLRGIFRFGQGGIAQGGFHAMQHGGIVRRPTLGLIGEGARPEAVVPLPNGRQIPVDLRGQQGQQEQVINNYYITAMDALSFDQFLKRNKGSVVNIVSEDMMRNGATIQSARRSI